MYDGYVKMYLGPYMAEQGRLHQMILMNLIIGYFCAKRFYFKALNNVKYSSVGFCLLVLCPIQFHSPIIRFVRCNLLLWGRHFTGKFKVPLCSQMIFHSNGTKKDKRFMSFLADNNVYCQSRPIKNLIFIIKLSNQYNRR